MTASLLPLVERKTLQTAGEMTRSPFSLSGLAVQFSNIVCLNIIKHYPNQKKVCTFCKLENTAHGAVKFQKVTLINVKKRFTSNVLQSLSAWVENWDWGKVREWMTLHFKTHSSQLNFNFFLF